MPQVDFNNHETGKHAALRGTLPCLAVAGLARKFALDQFFTRKGSCDESNLAVPNRGGAVHSFCGGGNPWGFGVSGPFTRRGGGVLCGGKKVFFKEKGEPPLARRFYRDLWFHCRRSGFLCVFL